MVKIDGGMGDFGWSRNYTIKADLFDFYGMRTKRKTFRLETRVLISHMCLGLSSKRTLVKLREFIVVSDEYLYCKHPNADFSNI